MTPRERCRLFFWLAIALAAIILANTWDDTPTTHPPTHQQP